MIKRIQRVTKIEWDQRHLSTQDMEPERKIKAKKVLGSQKEGEGSFKSIP